MIQQKAVFEIKVGERTYTWILSNDSPLDECEHVLSIMQSHISKLKKDAEKPPVEEKGE